MAGAVGPESIDLGLLSGLRYACRPGCGLCCFATPRADVGDLERIRKVAPAVETAREGRDTVLLARPDGGACQFLTSLRCTIHAARPHPCREFPITVHVGTRLQATAVLSCPGVDLGALGTHGVQAPAEGFDEELRSVYGRLSGARRLREEAVRRRRKIERALAAEGRWVDEEEVRAALREGSIALDPEDFHDLELPEAEGPLEALPMFEDGRSGPVALGRRWSDWEALEIAETGGGRSVGVFPPIEAPPELDPAGRDLWAGYLRLMLERDAFLAAVHLDTLDEDEGSVLDWAEAGLRAVGADVVTRGSFRARLRGRDPMRLGRQEVEWGIRATDAEWLDRPTWGDRL